MAAEAPVAYDLIEEIDRLRRGLIAAGYTAEALRERLGADHAAAGPSDVPLLLRRVGTDLLSALLRLFILQAPVPRAEVERALGDGALDDLLALRLARESDGLLEARVRLTPHAGLLLASDGFPGPDGLAADHVSGVTPSARICANLTVRRPARLSGIENVDVREGGLFEPVQGARFDLIVSNPPFVVAPAARFAYRDGGLRGDEFSARLVAETPAYLAEDGLATLMVSWLREASADPFARPRSWVDGSGCDAWLVAGRTLDPLSYAAAWADETISEPDLLGQELDAWVANLRELGAVLVVEGAVFLRRRSGTRNWLRLDTAPADEPEPATEHVLRVIAAHDRLAGLGDGGLLDSVLELAPSHRIETSFAARAGQRVEGSRRIRLLDGLLFAAEIDPHTAELLVRLDGRATLREALAAVTSDAGATEADVEPLARQAAAIAREMLGLGFLVFSGSPAP